MFTLKYYTPLVDTTTLNSAALNTAMTSNAGNKQHTRGWRLLQSILQGARYGHGCCEIDGHRMIILGGCDEDFIFLSSGFIYEARSEHSTPLPNDMPEALHVLCAVANERYMYVIGGRSAVNGVVNTVYRLSLETYQWTTMSPMGTARYYCAGVLLDDHIYIFGGNDDNCGDLASVERYSIVVNTWEDLPDMAVGRGRGHCAVAAMRNEIYILGGETRVLEVFDTALLDWKTETSLCDMPESWYGTAAVVLKNRYLVVIGGTDEDYRNHSGCLIYNCSINHWSSSPASMNMITSRCRHTAAILDGKIVVAGSNGDRQCLSPMEYIDARDVLEYAPLDYPLPQIYFNQILQLGKALLVSKTT